jgi:hypothetical protein
MILLFSLAAWLTTTASAPDGPNWETTFLVAIFTVIAWRRPDRYGPTLLITLHVFHWILVGKPSFVTLTALTITLIAIHQAAAVTDTIGSLRHLRSSLQRRWAWHFAVITATTPSVFWLATVRPPVPTAGPILMGAALLALALTALWLTPVSLRSPGAEVHSISTNPRSRFSISRSSNAG